MTVSQCNHSSCVILNYGSKFKKKNKNKKNLGKSHCVYTVKPIKCQVGNLRLKYPNLKQLPGKPMLQMSWTEFG